MVVIRFDQENGVRAIITRPSDAGEPHVLVLTDTGILPLLGLAACASADDSDLSSRLKLGPPLELRKARRHDGSLVPFYLEDDDEFWRATCDPTTGLVYIGTKATILQLEISGQRNTITVLAGQVGEEESIDGPGTEARVDRPFCMVADGRGSLLIKDCGSSRVRRVLLPPPGSPSGTPSPSVTTLAPDYAGNLWALAIEFSDPQRMYVATKTAIYKHHKLPYDTNLDAADPEAAAAVEPPAAEVAPELLVGREGDNMRADGLVAGTSICGGGEEAGGIGGGGLRGGKGACGRAGGGSGAGAGGSGGGSGGAAGANGTARFGHITFMLVDAEGRLIIVEREPHDVEPCLRIVWPCGLVTTFALDFEITGSEFVLAILPYGWLALHSWDGTRLQLVRMGPGLRPSLPPGPGLDTVAVTAAGKAAVGLPGMPGLGGLAADLGLLLEDAPEGAAADVTVCVDGREFGCHRAILGARCEYFRRLFRSGFADSTGSKLSLPDADPDAFALLLRYLYSASMDFPPPLLRPLAELADRLLLPAASRTAQRQLLAATCPSAVVDDLLWAEERGFVELLAGLKDYYLANAHRVLEEAPDSLELLMTRSPRLHLELYAAGIKRAKRL